MKVVHINKKDVEKEQAYLEEGREILRAISRRFCQRWLKQRELRLQQETKKPGGNHLSNIDQSIY